MISTKGFINNYFFDLKMNDGSLFYLFKRRTYEIERKMYISYWISSISVIVKDFAFNTTM